MSIQPQSNLIESVTGVVLAGGRSSRMGTDKARMPLQEHTLVEWSIAALSRCFAQTIVIANDPALHPGAIPDDVPGQGPLGGIGTALRRVLTNGIFVVACDMPFLNPAVIREIAGGLPGWDAAAIHGEYLHAAYSVSVLPVVEQRLASGDLSLHGLLAELQVNYLSETELARHPDWRRSFFNINTPEEFEHARLLVQQRNIHDSQDS